MKIYNLRVESPTSVRTAINKYSHSTLSYEQKMPNLTAINDYRNDIGYNNKTHTVVFARFISRPLHLLISFCFCSFEPDGILFLGLTKRNPVYEEQMEGQKRRYKDVGLSPFLVKHMSKRYAEYLNNFNTTDSQSFYNNLESDFRFNCHNCFIYAKDIKQFLYDSINHILTIKTNHFSIQLKIRKKVVDGIIHNPLYHMNYFKNYYEPFNQPEDIRVLGNPLNSGDDPKIAALSHISALKKKNKLTSSTSNILYANKIVISTDNKSLQSFLTSNMGFIISLEPSELAFIKLNHDNGLILLSKTIGSIPFSKNIKFYMSNPKKNRLFNFHKNSCTIIIQESGNFKLGFVLRNKAPFSYQAQNFNTFITDLRKHTCVHLIDDKQAKHLLHNI